MASRCDVPQLDVELLRNGVVIRSRVYTEPSACRVMNDWTARGPEYRVRNRPVTAAAKSMEVPVAGV